MDRRRAAGALLALAACIACSAAAPTASDHTALDLYDGNSEGCYYNFQHYGEGDRIMTNEPCLNCTCHNKMLMCYLRVCPFTKPIGQDCTVEKRADQCCPIVTCPDVPVDLLTSTSTTSPAEYGATGIGKLDKYGCSINGKYFSEGSKVPPAPNKPCEHCYCIRNMTTCVMQECTLHVDGCTPIYHKDVCCPVRYSCDHPEDEILLLDDMTTTVRPTPGFLLTTTTLSPVTQMTQDCIHDDQVFADGALIKTEKACEHCYCMKGDIVCVVQECGTPMENEGKNCSSLPPREGQCCPDTYICEGDEQSTEVPSDVMIQEDITTLSPPRRVGVEGSGYRNEPDEGPQTESSATEVEIEGSGEEQPNTLQEIDTSDLLTPGTSTPTINKDYLATTEKEQQYIPITSDSVTLNDNEISTQVPEPNKGINIIPEEVNTLPDQYVSSTTVVPAKEEQHIPSATTALVQDVEISTAKSVDGLDQVLPGTISEKESSELDQFIPISTSTPLADSGEKDTTEPTQNQDIIPSISPVSSEQEQIIPVTSSEPTIEEIKEPSIEPYEEHDVKPGDAVEVETEEPEEYSSMTTSKPKLEETETSSVGQDVSESEAVTEKKHSEIDHHGSSTQLPDIDKDVYPSETSEGHEEITGTITEKEMESDLASVTTSIPILLETEKESTRPNIVSEAVTEKEDSNLDQFYSHTTSLPTVEYNYLTTKLSEEKDMTAGFVTDSLIPVKYTPTTISSPVVEKDEKVTTTTSHKESSEPDDFITKTTVTSLLEEDELSTVMPNEEQYLTDGITEKEISKPRPTGTPAFETHEKTTVGMDIEQNSASDVTSKEQTESEIPKFTEPTTSKKHIIGDETTTIAFDISSIPKEESYTITTEATLRKEDSITPTNSQKPLETTIENTESITESIDVETKPTVLTSLDQQTTDNKEDEIDQPIESTTTAIVKEDKKESLSEIEEELTPTTPAADKIKLPETSTINIGDNEIDEDSIITAGRIPGEGDCLLNGITYRNESIVPSTNKCRIGCRCISSIIKCEHIVCSPPPEYMNNCQPTYDSSESCCPTYVCDHSKETIPPESQSQMSGTKPTVPSPTIECRGDQCEISDEKIHICSSGDCLKEPSAKPDSIDCGLEDCSQIPKHPQPIEHPEKCEAGKCDSTTEPCANGECQLPPIVEQALPVKPCEGDHCEEKSDESIIPQIPIVPCDGDGLGDCGSTVVSLPQDAKKEFTCTEENGCQKPKEETKLECVGESCRRKGSSDIDTKLPSPCTDPECTQQMPTQHSSDIDILITKSPEEEIGTLGTSQKPLVTEDQEVQNELPASQAVEEVKTTTKTPIQVSTEVDVSQGHTSSDMEDLITKTTSISSLNDFTTTLPNYNISESIEIKSPDDKLQKTDTTELPQTEDIHLETTSTLPLQETTKQDVLLISDLESELTTKSLVPENQDYTDIPLSPTEKPQNVEKETATEKQHDVETETTLSSTEKPNDVEKETALSPTEEQHDVETEMPLSPTEKQHDIETETPLYTTEKPYDVEKETALPPTEKQHDVETERPLSPTEKQHDIETETPLSSTEMPHDVEKETALSPTEKQHDVETETPLTHTEKQHDTETETPLSPTEKQHDVETETPLTHTEKQYDTETETPLSPTEKQHGVETETPLTHTEKQHDIETETPLSLTEKQHDVETSTTLSPTITSLSPIEKPHDVETEILEPEKDIIVTQTPEDIIELHEGTTVGIDKQEISSKLPSTDQAVEYTEKPIAKPEISDCGSEYCNQTETLTHPQPVEQTTECKDGKCEPPKESCTNGECHVPSIESLNLTESPIYEQPLETTEHTEYDTTPHSPTSSEIIESNTDTIKLTDSTVTPKIIEQFTEKLHETSETQTSQLVDEIEPQEHHTIKPQQEISDTESYVTEPYKETKLPDFNETDQPLYEITKSPETSVTESGKETDLPISELDEVSTKLSDTDAFKASTTEKYDKMQEGTTILSQEVSKEPIKTATEIITTLSNELVTKMTDISPEIETDTDSAMENEPTTKSSLLHVTNSNDQVETTHVVLDEQKTELPSLSVTNAPESFTNEKEQPVTESISQTSLHVTGSQIAVTDDLKHPEIITDKIETSTEQEKYPITDKKESQPETHDTEPPKIIPPSKTAQEDMISHEKPSVTDQEVITESMISDEEKIKTEPPKVDVMDISIDRTGLPNYGLTTEPPEAMITEELDQTTDKPENVFSDDEKIKTESPEHYLDQEKSSTERPIDKEIMLEYPEQPNLFEKEGHSTEIPITEQQTSHMESIEPTVTEKDKEFDTVTSKPLILDNTSKTGQHDIDPEKLTPSLIETHDENTNVPEISPQLPITSQSTEYSTTEPQEESTDREEKPSTGTPLIEETDLSHKVLGPYEGSATEQYVTTKSTEFVQESYTEISKIDLTEPQELVTKAPEIASTQAVITKFPEVVTDAFDAIDEKYEKTTDISKSPITEIQNTFTESPENALTETPLSLVTEAHETKKPEDETGHKTTESVETPKVEDGLNVEIPEITSPQEHVTIPQDKVTLLPEISNTKENEIQTEAVALIPEKPESSTPSVELPVSEMFTTEPSGHDVETKAPEIMFTESQNLGTTEKPIGFTTLAEEIYTEQPSKLDVTSSEQIKTESLPVITEDELLILSTESPIPLVTEGQQITTKQSEIHEISIDLQTSTEASKKPKPDEQEQDSESLLPVTTEPEQDNIATDPDQFATEKSDTMHPEPQETQEPVETSSKLPLSEENLTTTSDKVQVTSIPKHETPESTSYLIELEEHTHKFEEDLSTSVTPELTTKDYDKQQEQKVSESATEKPSTEENTTTEADKSPVNKDEKVSSVDSLQPTDELYEKPSQSTVSLEEITTLPTISELSPSQDSDSKKTTETIITELSTSTPITIEKEQTTSKVQATEAPEIQDLMTTRQTDEGKETSSEKPLEPDVPFVITPSEEVLITTSPKTTIPPFENATSQTPAPVDEYTKTEEKPSEILPTVTPELSKPGSNEIQPTDEVPSDGGQIAPSGTSGYGPEPDYFEEDQTFGPGTCRYGGKVYVSAQQIPRDDPCDFCFCFRSDIICLQQSCPPPIHGCHEEPIQGFCCPRYECPVSMATTLNVTTTTTTTTTTLPPHFPTHPYKGAAQRRGCQIKGHTYKVGEVVRASSGPCLHCTCGGDGQMKCDPKACTPEPMLRQMIAAAVSAKRRR